MMPLDERTGGGAVGVEMIQVGVFDAGCAVVAVKIEVCPAGAVAVLVIDVIKAVSDDVRPRSEVPLARHAGRISGSLQPLGDRLFRVESIERLAVALDAKSILISPAEQPGPRRHTLRCSDVSGRHPDTTCRQSVDMRCLHVLQYLLARQVRITVIVGENDDDVRLSGHLRTRDT